MQNGLPILRLLHLINLFGLNYRDSLKSHSYIKRVKWEQMEKACYSDSLRWCDDLISFLSSYNLKSDSLNINYYCLYYVYHTCVPELCLDYATPVGQLNVLCGKLCANSTRFVLRKFALHISRNINVQLIFIMQTAHNHLIVAESPSCWASVSSWRLHHLRARLQCNRSNDQNQAKK